MAIRDETRMLLESMTRLFEDHCTKQVVDAAETGLFADSLWDPVAETGVPLAALPEIRRWRRRRVVRPVRRVACRRAFLGADPIGGNHAGGLGRRVCGLETSDGPMSVGPVRAADKMALARTAMAGACPVRPPGCLTRRSRPTLF